MRLLYIQYPLQNPLAQQPHKVWQIHHESLLSNLAFDLDIPHPLLIPLHSPSLIVLELDSRPTEKGLYIIEFLREQNLGLDWLLATPQFEYSDKMFLPSHKSDQCLFQHRLTALAENLDDKVIP